MPPSAPTIAVTITETVVTTVALDLNTFDELVGFDELRSHPGERETWVVKADLTAALDEHGSESHGLGEYSDLLDHITSHPDSVGVTMREWAFEVTEEGDQR